MEEKIKVGRLVESYSYSFGRIIEINPMGFVVRWSYVGKELFYGINDTNKIKFYNDAETDYLD